MKAFTMIVILMMKMGLKWKPILPPIPFSNPNTGIELTNKSANESKQRIYVLSPDLVMVESGSFVMGDPDNRWDADEAPAHSVSLSAFYVFKFPVTFVEYDLYCRSTDKPYPNDDGKGRGKRPVVNVNWYDAIEYCNWRSKQEGLEPCYEVDKIRSDEGNNSFYDRKKWKIDLNLNANGYRLPTEAEWEYSARGGRALSTYLYSGSDKPDAVASISSEGAYPVEVGLKTPNDLGLFDMSGNTWELCFDWYGQYGRNAQSNPIGAKTGIGRVIRGGSIRSREKDLRVFNRSYIDPDKRNYYTGFRIVKNTDIGNTKEILKSITNYNK